MADQSLIYGLLFRKHDQTVNPACDEELYRLATTVTFGLERSDHVMAIGPEIDTTAHAAAETAQPGGAHQGEEGETFPDR
jgi:hypothetical protein